MGRHTDTQRTAEASNSPELDALVRGNAAQAADVLRTMGYTVREPRRFKGARRIGADRDQAALEAQGGAHGEVTTV